MPVLWFGLLLATICFEGAARKFIPGAPAPAFYFAKDVVLVSGLLLFGLRPHVLRTARRLYGAFILFLIASAAWTVLELFNPEHGSLLLGLIGLRAYWLWWIAPLVIASALRTARHRDLAVAVLAGITIVVAAFAMYQFARPPDATVNMHTRIGQEGLDAAETVHTTRRARVSSTFSYISGFDAFVSVVPGLLLALGLRQKHGWLRRGTMLAALLAFVAMPMSGSRSSMVLSVIFVGAVVLTAGIIRTRVGRRAALAAFIALPLAIYAAPEAVSGLQSRWEGSDTEQRVKDSLVVLPPVALATSNYYVLGLGTGMQQNARRAMGVRAPMFHEGPERRYLVELGVPGYLLFWLTRLGLLVGFIRLGLRARRRGQRSIAGAAFALATTTLLTNLTFDHVWQALYFTACGLVLHAYASPRTSGAAPAPSA